MLINFFGELIIFGSNRFDVSGSVLFINSLHGIKDTFLLYYSIRFLQEKVYKGAWDM